MTTLWLDIETYSPVPIRNGVHAYAEHAEVLLFAWAIDDGPVRVWDVTANGTPPATLRNTAFDEIVAHNAAFDRTVLRHAMPWLFGDVLSRWRCTMAKALAHGLPGALGILCDVLKTPTDQAKDKEGRQLVLLFCKPRPANSRIDRATRETHPAEWAKFVEYARLDIEAMRAIDAKLPSWNYRDSELALWHLDQRINDRGVAVDVELAEAAIRAVTQTQKVLARSTQELTEGDVESATQRDALLLHLLVMHGVGLPDLQQSTLQRRIEDPDLPPALRELLAIRLQASTTSTAKYKTLLAAVSRDGRLRGTLQFCGASRTGRWAGRVFQPQNLPRPTLPQSEIDAGIDALKADCADLIAPDVMQITSSALRGALIAPPGKKLVVADLSNIEGRMLAWLAGERWKVRAFADFDAGTGHDLYALAYAKAFGVPPEAVMENKATGDGSMRQIGKVMELALGYEGGVGAFMTFGAAYNIDLDAMAEAALANIPAATARASVDAFEWAERNDRTYGLSKRTYVVCDAFKRLWRAAHPETASWWAELEHAARRAIAQPGTTIPCRRVRLRVDGAWLRIVLPSGRALCYPSPRIVDGKVTYMGTNQYSRKWGRIPTYSGKLAENITQAASRDVLAAGMFAAEAAGYEIVLSVHDELITETADTAEFNANHLASLMATNPHWASGLPLAAAGFEAYRYRKD